ncbi:phage holin family protein [Verrucomicrobiaceae bacterium N1E253]|uniref:Phage holin family protein n=1 Tax=Oceaniferula marina TaxID=2748318 RepID=A0A851GPI8_9BACT|nr:phage holin family protein [Oceaniferula marina]NWK56740.1 phage holin family protein [Oceaniferula marina]
MATQTSNQTTQTPSSLGNEASHPGTPVEAPQTVNLPKEISDFIAARIELAKIEAQEAAEFSIRKAIHGVALALCGLFTWALVLAALTGTLAPWADRWMEGKIDHLPGWAAILFLLAFIHGVGALVFLGQLKKKPASPLFELSRQEIENDKQWLSNNK